MRDNNREDNNIDFDSMTPEQASEASIRLQAKIKIIENDIMLADEIGSSPDGFGKDEIKFWEWRHRAIKAIRATRSELEEAIRIRGGTIPQIKKRVHELANKFNKEILRLNKLLEDTKEKAANTQKKNENLRVEISNLRNANEKQKETIMGLKLDRHRLIVKVGELQMQKKGLGVERRK